MNVNGSLHPDVVYLNGAVVTMDDANPRAEAVATLADRIVAVGSSVEIGSLAGPRTRVIDLAGKTMLPGLSEPHSHFSMYGAWKLLQVNLNSPPLGPASSIADLVEILAERASTTPEGQWVLGYSYDDTRLAEGRHPTRHDLDRACADRPIWITHITGHFGVANSRALEIAGITRGTPNPPGGIIRRDPERSEPNGVLEEMPAQEMVVRLLPRPTLEQRLEGMALAAGDYLRMGVTSNCDAGVALPGLGSPDEIAAYQKAVARGVSPIRTTMMIAAEVLLGPRGGNGSFLTGFGGSRLKIGPAKIIGDGAIQGYTAWLSKPYHTPYGGDATYRGYAVTPVDRLQRLVVEAHRAGFQLAVHGNGDATIDAILEAYRRAQDACPRSDARHRIEHCQTVREDQLDTMAELGVTPSFFVSHTYYWGDRHKSSFLGPERAARISPLKSALARGIKFSIHSDCPITPVSPLFCVFAAVNRVTREGDTLGPEYRLTPLEALRAVTTHAAWQSFDEKIRGSIQAGKLADFTVLAENPLAVPPHRIKDIKVEEVVIGGNSVYGVNSE